MLKHYKFKSRRVFKEHSASDLITLRFPPSLSTLILFLIPLPCSWRLCSKGLDLSQQQGWRSTAALRCSRCGCPAVSPPVLAQVLLNELGMDEPFLTPLRERFLRPLTALLYPELGGACLDSHKAFVVKYALHEDLDLSSHYDNAEVTLNVSLGKEFTEGNLYFGDFNEVLSTAPSPSSPPSFRAFMVF